jgi:hypothetical protein
MIMMKKYTFKILARNPESKRSRWEIKPFVVRILLASTSSITEGYGLDKSGFAWGLAAGYYVSIAVPCLSI